MRVRVLMLTLALADIGGGAADATEIVGRILEQIGLMLPNLPLLASN